MQIYFHAFKCIYFPNANILSLNLHCRKKIERVLWSENRRRIKIFLTFLQIYFLLVICFSDLFLQMQIIKISNGIYLIIIQIHMLFGRTSIRQHSWRLRCLSIHNKRKECDSLTTGAGNKHLRGNYHGMLSTCLIFQMLDCFTLYSQILSPADLL